LDDELAQTYTVFPFVRKKGILNEPDNVNTFKKMFLTPRSIDYFSDPVCIDN